MLSNTNKPPENPIARPNAALHAPPHELARPAPALPRWAQYALALLMVAAATGLRLLMDPWVGKPAVPYVTFNAAVALTAFLWGRRPGILATIVGALACDFFISPPRFTLMLGTAAEMAPMAFFIATGLLVSVLAGRLHSARQLAQEQRQLLAVTLASIGDGVIVTDRQGRVTFLNREAEHLTGWTDRDAQGQDLAAVFKIVNEETRQLVESPVAKVLRLGTVVGLANHTLLIAKDGRELPIDDSGAPIRQSDGTFQGVVLVFREITQRKQAEDALRQSRAVLQAIIDNAPDLIYVKDLQGRITIANQPLGDALKLKVADIIGKTSRQIVADPKLAEVHMANDQRVLDTGQPLIAEESTPAGTFLSAKFPLRDAQGRIFATCGISTDITQRKRAEEALRQSEERLRFAMEGIQAGEWELDLLDHTAHRSLMHDRIFGYETLLPQWTYEMFLEHVLPEDRALVDREFRQSVAARQVWNFECRIIRHGDQAQRWIWACGRCQNDAGGAPKRLVGIVQDITDRKRAEEQFHLYLAVLQAAANAVVITGADGTIQWVNPAFTRLTGYSAAEAQGQNPRVLKSGQQDAAFFQHMWQTITAGQVWQGELVNRRKDGTLYSEEMTITPVRDATGQITHYIAIKQDITARKLAEEALRASEEQFRRAIEEAPIPVIMHAEDGQVLQLSRTWTELTGYALADMPTFDVWLNQAYGEGAQLVRDYVHSLFRGDQRSIGIDFPIRTRAGPVRHWSYSASAPGTLRDGRRFVVAMAVDITERQRAEETQSRLAAIVESSDDAIVSTSLDGTILSWNAAAQRLFGYQPEEIVGQPITRLLPPERVQEEEMILTRLRRGERLAHFETTRLAKDGRQFDVSVTVSPVMDRHGHVVGASKILRDITQLKQAELALQRTAQELARSNKDLEQFAYVASHDLQEPLRMVTGYLQLIDRRYKDKLDQDAREFIGFAVDGATRMSRLITDLLDYSRIHTRGKPPEAVPMEAVLQRALENLAVAIRDSAAEITHDPLPTVRGDATQLTQLLQNLVGNALKFRAPQRPVQVYIGAEKKDDGWLFSVRDNGIGIEPQYADKIFLIFQRLHSRAEYPGTGIGLAVCKKIVERHGGRIWVESRPGPGATFFFTIGGPVLLR